MLTDFISYYPLYNDTNSLWNLTESSFNVLVEPGFVVYMSFFKSMGFDYFAWIAISSLFDIIVLAIVFKRYCKSMILPLIFYIAFNGLLIEFNLYRNIKGMDLFLLSLPYLQERKILPYIVLNLIGCLFHSSSILYIPLYFVLNYRMSQWMKWSGFIIANIIFWFNIPIMTSLLDSLSMLEGVHAYEKIMGYDSKSAEEYKFSIGFIERTFAFVLFTLMSDKLSASNKINNIFYNCFWIYYCSFLLFYEVYVFVERIPYLFIFSYWFLYANVMYIKTKFRQLIRVCVKTLVVLKIITSYNIPTYEYENLIFGISSYDVRKNIAEKNMKGY